MVYRQIGNSYIHETIEFGGPEHRFFSISLILFYAHFSMSVAKDNLIIIHLQLKMLILFFSETKS